MQYQFCVSCSIKCVMIANNELRRIWKEAAVAHVNIL
jgi:hypothetical protein